MKKFIVIALMTATFLGGYYLGRLPSSPDIFGWMSCKYQETKKLSLKPSQDSPGLAQVIRPLGCVVELFEVLAAPPADQQAQEARQ